MAFNTLTTKLTQAPILCYPSFDKEFVLETDASIEGIGAVLSQPQNDGHLHPIAYASRALSQQECNYAVTGLVHITLSLVFIRPLGDRIHGPQCGESRAGNPEPHRETRPLVDEGLREGSEGSEDSISAGQVER